MQNRVVSQCLKQQCLLPLSSILLVVGACTQPEDPVQTGDTDSVLTSGIPEGGTSDEETGAADSGSGGTPPGPVLVQGCLLEDPDPDMPGPAFGYVHQCGGRIFAAFGASNLEAARTELFGSDQPDDPYAAPKVVACCDPLEEPSQFEVPHHAACYIDMIETACRSLPVRIVEAAQDGPAVVRPQATRLANWIASEGGQEDCKREFRDDSGFDQDDPGLIQHTWNLPNRSGLDGWPAIEDPFVRLDAEILSLFLPDSRDERLECEDNGLSDDQIFIVNKGTEEETRTLARGVAHLSGKNYFEPDESDPLVLDLPLAATENGCIGEHGCSLLAVGDPDGSRSGWTLETMNLNGASRVASPGRKSNVVVERFRLQLAGPAPAFEERAGVLRVEPGDAVFAVSGRVAGTATILYTTNKTPIVLRSTGSGGWNSSSFSATFTDTNGEVWRLTLPPSAWAR